VQSLAVKHRWRQRHRHHRHFWHFFWKRLNGNFFWTVRIWKLFPDGISSDLLQNLFNIFLFSVQPLDLFRRFLKLRLQELDCRGWTDRTPWTQRSGNVRASNPRLPGTLRTAGLTGRCVDVVFFILLLELGELGEGIGKDIVSDLPPMLSCQVLKLKIVLGRAWRWQGI